MRINVDDDDDDFYFVFLVGHIVMLEVDWSSKSVSK